MDLSVLLRGRFYKFRFLTTSMVLWFVLFPVLEGSDQGLIVLNVITTSIVVLGTLAVSDRKRSVIISLIFGVPWFILSWIDILIVPLPLVQNSIANLFLIVFLTITAITILLYIIRSKQVSGDLLFGAVSIYFLIGGTFSMIYMLLESLQPGSIISNVSSALKLSDYIYFSYITLTTLGYGEIIPVTASARSIAILEAIIGVMYVAVIISRLVGLFIVKSYKE